MTGRRRAGLAVISIAALLVLASPAGAATITTFPVEPTGGPAGSHRPIYITTSPLGTLWFTDMGSEPAVRGIDVNGRPIATITDSTGLRYGPDLGFAPNGTLYWVLNEPGVSGLGSRSPSGVVTIADNNDVKEGYALGFNQAGVAYYSSRHKSPDYWGLCTASACGGFGTASEMTDLTLGPEGGFWGPEPSEDQFSKVNGLTVDLAEGTNPIRSVLGPDGNFWVAALGTLATPNRILRITPSGQQTSFVLPPERTPTDITVGPDGALWFTEFTSNSIGRLTTGGDYSSCPLPNASANPRPYGITAGPDGAIWFTEREGGAIGRLSGNCTPQAAVADTTAPALGALRLSRTAFRAAPAGASISARGKKAPLGTKVTFTLSEPATVTFTVEARSKGRKVGKRCAKPTPSNSARKSCVRWTKAKGAFTVTGKAGANSFTFRGRLGGKALKPGAYRLNGLAKDAAKNASAVQRKSFTILP